MANSTKFKRRQEKSKYIDIAAYEEEYVLISFRYFLPKESPKNLNLHRKTNEALKNICSKTWRSFLESRRDTLGGMEYISTRDCKVIKPSSMKDERFIVVDCGRKVGRLFGYKDKNIFHILELDTFEKYKH